MEDEQDKSKILEEAKKKLETAEDKTNKVSGQGKVDDATKYKTEVVGEFKEKMEVANDTKKQAGTTCGASSQRIPPRIISS